jgi:NADPH:quinone reductase-like Zn-dependent oxidoreductase/predicted dehydrogenase
VKPIGVGIIGASPSGGWAAATHVPALRALPRYDLRAVATNRPESARRAAAEWDVEAFHDPRQLIAHPGVDLVVVAVKVPDHHDLVAQAVAAGKMVFSEWPLGIDLPQAEDLTAMAAAAGVPTVIGLQARFDPVVAHVRDLIRQGYLGRVLATNLVGSGQAWGPVIDPSRAYAFDAANGVTPLSVSVGHALDALTFALGDVDSVTATLGIGHREISVLDSAPIRSTTPDQVAVTAALHSGAVASIFYRGGLSRAGDLRWEINGIEGDLLVTSPAANGNIQATELALAAGHGSDVHVQPMIVPDEYSGAGLHGPARNVAALYAAFARDLDEGSAVAPSFGDAVRLHRLVDRIASGASTAGAKMAADFRGDIMRAAVLTAYNTPLRVSEIRDPTPDPGEVLVRVVASGVNPLDTKIRRGEAGHAKMVPPAILGIDMAGVVEAVGERVDGFRVGDEVFGMTGGVGGVAGSLAELTAVDARLIAHKPNALSMAQSAALPLGVITSWEGLVDRAGVASGHRVLIHGGAGGVGFLAVQLALARGAQVFATGGPSSQEVIRQVGATPIDYTTSSVDDYVDAHTGGEGFDIVVDNVGGGTLDASFSAVKRYTGHVVSALGWGTHSLAPLSFRGAT